jgi:hypothetical protein
MRFERIRSGQPERKTARVQKAVINYSVVTQTLHEGD